MSISTIRYIDNKEKRYSFSGENMQKDISILW